MNQVTQIEDENKEEEKSEQASSIEELFSNATYNTLNSAQDKFKNSKYGSMVIDKTKNIGNLSKEVLSNSKNLIGKKISTKFSPVMQNIHGVTEKVLSGVENKASKLNDKVLKLSNKNVGENFVHKKISVPNLSSNPSEIEQNLNSIGNELGIVAKIEQENYIEAHKRKDLIHKPGQNNLKKDKEF